MLLKQLKKALYDVASQIKQFPILMINLELCEIKLLSVYMVGAPENFAQDV